MGKGEDGPRRGGILTYHLGNPAYIDPYNAGESEGIQVEQALFDSLTEIDPKDPTQLVGAAAESWESNADASVWTFRLRQDAKFHDGTPVTAADFVYAWNRIADPDTVNTGTKKPDPSQVSYHLAAIKGTDDAGNSKTGLTGLVAKDEHTLEVSLKYPFADFEYVVAHPALAPVPEKLVEGGVEYEGKKVPFGEMPIGNGPFKMAEPWKADRYIKVVRNDEYANGEVALLDGIEFRIFKDADTAYTEFVAGNLDFSMIGDGKIADARRAYGVSADGYVARPGEQVLLGSENGVYFLVVNNDDAVLKNDKVRRALSYAINRQAISDTIFDGTLEPAGSIVPPGIAGYQPGLWPDAKYDVEAARQMLADAGFPGGKGIPTLKLAFNNEGGHEKVMQLIQADLQKIGVKTRFETADFPTFIQQLGAGEHQLARLTWQSDYPIMDNFLYSLFRSDGDANLSRYANAEVDSALTEARKNTDRGARIKAYQDVHRTIGEALPVIPLMFDRHHHVASGRVRDLNHTAMNLTDFAKVWIEESAAE